MRWAPSAVVLVLLAATALAFVSTERRKLERNPIVVNEIERTLSPVCNCATRTALIDLRLRKPDTVSLEIADDSGRVVRTLVERRRVRGLSVRWNGRDDAGRLLGDGTYQPRLQLRRVERTFSLPNPIVLDTLPPRATLVRVRPRVLRPGRRLVVSYSLSERARPLLYVDGRRRVRGKFQRPTGQLEWFGQAGGRALRPGRYLVQLAARDPAGNLGPRTRPVTIRLR